MPDVLIARPIHQLAPLLEKKEISPLELFNEAMERIHQLQPKLNSFITITEEEGRKAASRSGRRNTQRSIPWPSARNPDFHQGPLRYARRANNCGLQSTRQVDPRLRRHRGCSPAASGHGTGGENQHA